MVVGDCLSSLRAMPDSCVQCVVTSPPYWGLRDYGTAEWEGGDPACDHRRGRQTGRITPKTKRFNEAANVAHWSRCRRCGAVAVEHNRRAVGLELNPQYAELIRDRMKSVQPRLPGC